MISVGQKVDLSIPVRAAVDGEKWEGLLSQLITRPTVVSVYMRNNTSSCDKQTQQMQVVAPELEKGGIGLIGLSKDTPGSHVKYGCKLELSFPLVSDPEHAFASATDSLVDKKMYGKVFVGPTRSAYLIDADGTVLGIVEKVDSANHGEQLKALVKEI
ncbi:peroxiredoxin [Pelagicoccus mobilis]|uniref:thioredoxin-dependent peroxiredoxin n=1 Tax=Pelagicoccus mobilis TaxID=415221 RepID=A0A934VS63_9BACT|nr:redoxin domain-containing protein [Pelagicoccus mobilis]MBK1878194.1 redoxin domain-containing protein [Pelagicoccus mobilis]